MQSHIAEISIFNEKVKKYISDVLSITYKTMTINFQRYIILVSPYEQTNYRNIFVLNMIVRIALMIERVIELLASFVW